MNQQQFSFIRDKQTIKPFKSQLLKWIGNKQRFAHEIIGYFPEKYNTYFEPFVGSGAVLASLAPNKAVASDILTPLIEIWKTLVDSPEEVKRWYKNGWNTYYSDPSDHRSGYNKIKDSFNKNHNGADFLFLTRSCYGGVVRFRKNDGHMSTPCGVHKPISPESFNRKVDEWHSRVKNTLFLNEDFESVMNRAQKGDLIYCDPPYVDSQAIVYGAQEFDLQRLFRSIQDCKNRGVFVALSIDGTKKTGSKVPKIDIPDGLFKNVASVNCGRSMLRRFQMNGETLESEVVTDRLLLTY